MHTSKEWEHEEDSSKKGVWPEAKAEVRKKYTEITIDLDLVKVTGDI